MLNIDDRFLGEANQDQFWFMCHVAKFMNEDGTCFPSNQTLCERTGWKISKLNAVKKSCIESKMLKSETRYIKNQQSSNVYTIATDRLSIMVNLKGKKAIQTPTALAAPYRDGGTTPTAMATPYPVTLATPEVLTNEVLTNERENTHAQILSIIEAPLVTNDIAGPGLGDFPRAKTPAELQNELRAFYARFPEEWNFITSETPAKLQAPTQRAECVKDFCAWAIGEGWEKRDFGKINARLIRWFKDEARMKPKSATQSNTPTYSRPAGIKSA